MNLYLKVVANIMSNQNYLKFYLDKGEVENEFVLNEVSEDFIFKELNNLKCNKGTGMDQMPARFIKDAACVIKTPITHIINSSIRTEKVPHEMKQARVTPLYKKNNKFDVGNYRPVSILSIVSKILEKSVNEQLCDYLTNKNLLYQYQSGFRKAHSTDTCLIYLQDYIRSHIAQGNYTGMVLIDIQKAFDSVDHNILCSKLKAMGIGSVDWFKSYLEDREQMVMINDTLSKSLKITCGVPQGSILGPILFPCFKNDMPNSLSAVLFQYADDSAILVSDKNICTIRTILNENLKECFSWLVDNKLSMHPGKTELILFGSRRRLNLVTDFNVICEGHVIHNKTAVKYLGLNIDHLLCGEEIVSNIVMKVNNRIKFLYRQAQYFDLKTKKNLVSALVLCYFDYSISSWFMSLTALSRSKLQVAQNKALRFVLNVGPRVRIEYADFKLLNLLNVELRAKQLRLHHMYNIYNNKSPVYMNAYFCRMSEVHNYGTRGSHFNYQLPKSNTNISKTFHFNATKDWNSLPSNIKDIHSKSTFKYVCKKWLFGEMNSEM